MKFKIICVIQVKFLKKFNFKYPKNKGKKRKQYFNKFSSVLPLILKNSASRMEF